jgi:hypothetical protein
MVLRIVVQWRLGVLLVMLMLAAGGCQQGGGHSVLVYEEVKGDRGQRSTFLRDARLMSQVVMVCVFEDRLTRMPPGDYHRWDGTATVVRSFKGDYKVGEILKFHRPMEAWPENWAPRKGRLMFFLDDATRREEMLLDTGQCWEYSAMLERAAESELLR